MNNQTRNWVGAVAVAALLIAGSVDAGAQGFGKGSSSSSGSTGNAVGNAISSDNSSARILNSFALIDIAIFPEDVQIYVDGVFSGTASEYNLDEKSMKLLPGEHIIVLFHSDYTTIRVAVRVDAGRTYRLAHDMTLLSASQKAMSPLAALFMFEREEFELKPITHASNLSHRVTS
jgi:hypothetical protein